MANRAHDHDDYAQLLVAAEAGQVGRRTLLKRGMRLGIGLPALLSLWAIAPKKTPIPPNCIFVCCDATCDAFCLKCVKWPDKTTGKLTAI